MSGFDPITSVVWKDPHQTMVVLKTGQGREHVLPAKFMPRGMVAQSCYTPLAGRYANEDHSAAVIETVESGAVMATPDGTPALWEAAHATVHIVPYGQEAKAPEQPTELPVIPLPEPASAARSRAWSMDALLRRAAGAEEPAPVAVPLILQDPISRPEAMPEAMNDTGRVETAVSLAMTLDDGARRRQAQIKLGDCLDSWMVKTSADRSRYELAVQALNDLPFALEVFAPEAKTRGITIQELCREAVTVHQAAQRRMGHVYTIKAKAIADINAATGDDIDAIATAAASAIMGE